MNKGETFVLLWRLLGYCDKALVRNLVKHYWLPAEAQLAASLRTDRLRELFCGALSALPPTERWFALLNAIQGSARCSCGGRHIGRRANFMTIGEYRLLNGPPAEATIEKHHQKRMRVIS